MLPGQFRGECPEHQNELSFDEYRHIPSCKKNPEVIRVLVHDFRAHGSWSDLSLNISPAIFLCKVNFEQNEFKKILIFRLNKSKQLMRLLVTLCL